MSLDLSGTAYKIKIGKFCAHAHNRQILVNYVGMDEITRRLSSGNIFGELAETENGE